MTRYFFDVSGVLDYIRHGNRFTGIQRVVVTLTDTVCRKLPQGQCFISYMDKWGTYRAVPYTMLDGGRLTDPDLLRASFGIGDPESPKILYGLEKYENNPLRARYHLLRWQLYSVLGRSKYKGRSRQFSRKHKSQKIPKIESSRQLSFDEVGKNGDHIVVLDAVWGLDNALSAFRKYKSRGIFVHTMLHDLIPIVLPQVVDNGTLRSFEPWLRHSHEYTSNYLTVSESTGRDLARFLVDHDIDRPIHVTPLVQAALPMAPDRLVTSKAHERSDGQPSVSAEPGLESQRIRAVLAHPFVLCVGTLEIRKNIWKIAQAWQRLSTIENLPLPKLVFVGQRGWMIQDFERMMEATGFISGWVDVIQGVSDVELNALYRHCLFTITASQYEGWGLPIGESLAYGKTAVVSQTSSMPEVGGDLVEYCDPHSIDSIVRACRKLIEDEDCRIELEQRISKTNLRQWDDVAEDLLSILGISQVGDVQSDVETHMRGDVAFSEP